MSQNTAAALCNDPVTPCRKVAFVGSECYPFVKTGGLGDVMYALPRALLKEDCEVRVILPLYNCMADKYKKMLEYKGSFMMDLTLEGRTFYVGIMEAEMDGVTYDFIDNKEFFDWAIPIPASGRISRSTASSRRPPWRC